MDAIGLTTVYPPKYEMGYRGMSPLLSKLGGEGGADDPLSERMPCRLSVRESVYSARALTIFFSVGPVQCACNFILWQQMYKSKNRGGSVLIVTPVLREYHCARESFAAKESADYDFRYAETCMGPGKVKIVHTGYGIGRWIEQVSPTDIPDLLLDTGTAGGLADGIAIGQILSGRTFLYGREPEIEANRGLGLSSQVKECTILTVDSPVVDSRQRRALAKRADICTMESYFLAAAAEAWGCAFASVRVVSDLADENTVPNFRKNVRSCCMELYGFLKQSLLNISN